MIELKGLFLKGEISTRTYNCLKAADNYFIEDLAGLHIDKIKLYRNLGTVSLIEIVSACNKYGVAIEGELLPVAPAKDVGFQKLRETLEASASGIIGMYKALLSKHNKLYKDFLELKRDHENAIAKDVSRAYPITEEWLLNHGFTVYGACYRISYGPSGAKIKLRKRLNGCYRVWRSTDKLRDVENTRDLQLLWLGLTGKHFAQQIQKRR